MAIDKLPTAALEPNAITADLIATGAITVSDIPNGEITADKLHTTLDLSTKTLTLPSSSVTSHISVALNDLTDVNTSGASSGNVITYNGSSWIVGTGGPANTDALTEGSSNLYYTDARARAAISENSTQLSYNNSTGVLTFTQGNTDTVAEGSSNLYYTDARTDARVALQTGTNLNLSSKSTTNLSEGSNLYYTSTRAQAETLGGSLSGTVSNARIQYGTSYSGTPAQGNFFFDSLNQKLKVYTGSTFVDAVPSGGGGGGGGGSTDANTTFRKYIYDVSSSTNSVSGKDSVVVTAGSFVTGYQYQIIAVGNTDFTAIGASGNTVGVTFTATGTGTGTGTAGHVLNYLTNGTENVEVFVNGVKQVEGSSKDYVATTGSSVTFVSNLASGDVIDIQVYELLTNSAYYTQSQTYTQTQTNSQISTAVAGYLPLAGGTMTGSLDVNSFQRILANNALFFMNTNNSASSYIKNTLGAGAANLRLGVMGDDKVTILSNGNVGIGTTSPSYTLDIASSGTLLNMNSTNSNGIGTVYRNSGTAIGYVGSSKYVHSATIGDFAIGTASSNNLTFGINSSEKMRITSAGHLLVGKISTGLQMPGHEFIAGGQTRHTRDNATVMFLNREGSNNGGILEFYRDNSIVGNIGVADGDNLYISSDDTNDVGLKFNGDGNRITPCNASGADRGSAIDLGEAGSGPFKDLYLSGVVYGSDTTGNPVGNHNPGYMLHPSNGSHFMRDGGNPVRIGRDASNGSLTEYFRQGVQVGKIEVFDTDNIGFLSNVSNHGGIICGTSSIVPTLSGTYSNGNTDLGTGTAKWRNLYLSGGVDFGNASSIDTGGESNLLDDYETGTWTPKLKDLNGNEASAYTSGYPKGTYIKIGRHVWVNFSIRITNKGSMTGNYVHIANLPFNKDSTAEGRGTGTIDYYSGLATTKSYLALDTTSTVSVFWLVGGTNATGSHYVTVAHLNNTCMFKGGGNYIAT